MNIAKHFSKSLTFLVVAFFSFGLLVSVAGAITSTGMVNSPNGGEKLKGTQSISWKTTSCSSGDTVDIILGYNGGTTANPGTTKTIDSAIDCSLGNYSVWDTNDSSIGDRADFVIGIERFASTGSSLETDYSDGFFTIDNTAPTFVSNDGTNTGPVQTDTIQITTADNLSGVASQEYGFSTDNICDSSDTISTAFTSGTPFLITGNHTDYLCAKATDNAGNIGYQFIGKLNTDNTSPTVLSYTLDGSAADTYFNPTMPDTAAISITADEPVTWTTLRVQDVATGLIQKDTHPSGVNTILNTTWDGSLSTGGPLVDGAYTLYYTMTDVAGNVTGPIAGPLTPHQIIVDTVVPTMTSVVATTIQGGGDTIVVTFSEDVVAADGDWTDGNELGFVSPIGTPVDTSNANFSFNSSTNVLTVTLDEATDMSWLKNGLLLRAFTTANKIEDLAGNQVVASQDDTSIDGDSVAPTVGLTYDIDRQVKDADTIVITATFNEEMENTPQIAIATLGDGSLAATNMSMGATRAEWTYSWDVPAGSDEDGTATITITGEDLAGNTVTDSSNTRTIDNTVPLLNSFTNPTAETVYKTNPILTFSASDNSGTEVCSYSLDGGTTYTPLASCNETNAVVAGLVEGRNVIELKIEDEAGNVILSGNPSFVYDTDGILTVDDTSSTNPDFPTIQEANDAWIVGITTIQVAPGTYGATTIDKGLMIKGANAGIDPNIGSRTTESTIGGGSGNILVINSDNVTIDGFTITNYGGTSGTGIYSSDYNNLTIKNNRIDNIGNTFDDVVGRGIVIVSSALAVDNITITNNKIFLITSGLRTGSNSTSASGISIGWTSGSHDITDLLIQDNVISDIDADTSAWTVTTKGQGAYGILINHGTAGGKTPGAQIIGNTISNLEGLWAHGIGLEGDTPNASITGNTISDLTDHKTPSDAVGVHIEDNPGAGSVKINNNSFGYSIKVGVDSVGSSLGTVDATDNWWGDATGPFNYRANPTGNGPAVYPSIADEIADGLNTSVDFSPFYNSATMTDLVSVDPIASFDLAFNPASQTVNQNSTLTVTAKDSLNYLVVNDSTTHISLIGDNGASFGSNLLTMGILGTTNTTITNSITGDVHVTALEVGGAATGIGTISFTAGADTTAPVISNVQVTSITSTGATITWDTDENSTSQVEYGQTSSYGAFTTLDSTLTTNHSVAITGLTNGTVYHFRVHSNDTNANPATSVDSTFTTDSVDNTPPTITLVGNNPLTLTVGDTFTDPGATANDDVDGDISSGITFGGTIADGDVTTAAGTYTVTYDVDDVAGNHAVQETRTVIVNATFDDTATLVVTGIDAVQTYATADDTYANGWSWTYHITVPTSETDFSMKFSDFISGANSISAGSNIRFYTAQASANADQAHAISITAANTYSPAITLDSDLAAGTAGRQIDVTVEMKVPVGSTGGSYSGSYGVSSNSSAE